MYIYTRVQYRTVQLSLWDIAKQALARAESVRHRDANRLHVHLGFLSRMVLRHALRYGISRPIDAGAADSSHQALQSVGDAALETAVEIDVVAI
jgi:hypothetical protein